MNIENQVEQMARAIQAVFLKRGIPLYQHDLWYGNSLRPAERTHRYAIGDTVVTITADPIDFSLWTKVRKEQVEREIQAEVAARLGVHGILGKEMTVNISEKNHSVVVQISRPNPAVYGWNEISQYSTGGIVLGRDIMRQPILLDFERSVPGYMVTGASRSGKTNFLRLLIAQAIRKGYEVYLVHMKPGGIRDYKDLIPHLTHMAHDEEGAEKVLANIEARVVKRNQMKESTDNRIIFIWDEASEPFTPPEMQVRLGALAKGAGSSNIFMFVGVQNATKQVHKDVRYNLINRVAFRADKVMAAHNTGLTDSGVDKFKVGEALVVTEGFSQRITTPRAEAEDLGGYMSVLEIRDDYRNEDRVKPHFQRRSDKTLGDYLETLAEKDRREVAWITVYKWRYRIEPTFDTFKAMVKGFTGSARVTKARYDYLLNLALKGFNHHVLENRRLIKREPEQKWLRKWSRILA